MAEGVEWALHSCVNLAWVARAVPTSRLAGLHGLPAPYMNKQLQALAREGILTSVPGPRGGFRLNRSAAEVSLLDVVVAVEGRETAFRCTQILAEVPGVDPSVDYRRACAISQNMRRAEMVWRRELAGCSVADVAADVARQSPEAPQLVRAALVGLTESPTDAGDDL